MSSNSTVIISKNTPHLSVSSSDRGSKCCLSKKALITALAVSTVFAAALAVVVTCILILHTFSVITLPLWACIGAVSIEGVACVYVLVGVLILYFLKTLKDISRSAKKEAQLIRRLNEAAQLLEKQLLEKTTWDEQRAVAINNIVCEKRALKREIQKAKIQCSISQKGEQNNSSDTQSKTSLNPKEVRSRELRKKMYHNLLNLFNSYPEISGDENLGDLESAMRALVEHHAKTKQLVEERLKLTYVDLGYHV